MQDCIQRVVTDLRTDELSDIRERLLEAALLIEKFKGMVGWQGISAAVDEAVVSPESIADLRAKLIDFAQHRRELPDVGTALWALGRFRDDSLRDFFLAELRHHFEQRHLHAVQQVSCVLEDIDGGTIYEYAPGETCHDKFYEAVRDYLDKNAA
jgi:hypothetical protein